MVCLSIRYLRDIWVVSTFRLFWMTSFPCDKKKRQDQNHTQNLFLNRSLFGCLDNRTATVLSSAAGRGLSVGTFLGSCWVHGGHWRLPRRGWGEAGKQVASAFLPPPGCHHPPAHQPAAHSKESSSCHGCTLKRKKKQHTKVCMCSYVRRKELTSINYTGTREDNTSITFNSSI